MSTYVRVIVKVNKIKYLEEDSIDPDVDYKHFYLQCNLNDTIEKVIDKHCKFLEMGKPRKYKFSLQEKRGFVPVNVPNDTQVKVIKEITGDWENESIDIISYPPIVYTNAKKPSDFQNSDLMYLPSNDHYETDFKLGTDEDDVADTSMVGANEKEFFEQYRAFRYFTFEECNELVEKYCNKMGE